MLCQILELQRDLFLSLLRNVEPEMVQRLSHAALGPANELFPSALLKEVYEFKRDHWHNSAILQVAGFSLNPRGSTPAPISQSSHAVRNSKKAVDGFSKGKGLILLFPPPLLLIQTVLLEAFACAWRFETHLSLV